MTDEEILKLKEHIKIHEQREPRAIKITELLKKAVDELERIEELKQQNSNLLESCEGATMLYRDWCRAKEVVEGLMRFCRCFAQHHLDDVRYREAERFLEEVRE